MTAVGDSAIGAAPGRAQGFWWPAAPAAAFVATVLVGAGVRWWQVSGRSPLSWNDTADFLHGSGAPWTSLELWAGRRPPGAAVVLKLAGGDIDSYVRAQAAFAAVCWAVLAGSVATVVTGRARWPLVALVAGLSLTTPVTMWDRSVLSESLAVSALALVAAALVQLARGVTWGRVAAVLAASTVWLATRDSHAVVAIAGGAGLLAAAAALWWRARRSSPRPPGEDGDGDAAAATPGAGAARRLAGLGAGAVVLGLLVVVGSAHGERHHFPTRNVYEVRVLPYPDRVEWFADRGMPQAEVFAGPDARAPHVEPGIPPVMFVGDDDAELRPWLDWVESDGRAAFARYTATHPLYLVSEPLRSPERAFNNALGDRGFYRPLDMPRVPLVDSVLALPTAVVLLVAALVGGWAIGRGRWTPGLAAGAALGVLAVPHGLVAWHSDGMETARHLVVPALQLHLGVLLVVVGVLSGEIASGGSAAAQTSGKPRSRLGRSSPPSASTTVPVT
ncbi:MAG TPA: hypothetical protein VFH36_11660 [Acidimicrobiales bacterium]|nr:hypothetical protein [Acidimicrobiales bacterium]